MIEGAISKALITTAVGLIIAIPSLSIYHFFKYRINTLGVQLEIEFELLVNAWLLKGDNLKSASPEGKTPTAAKDK
jgi:biopolymer transport protein ExbB/TolQ